MPLHASKHRRYKITSAQLESKRKSKREHEARKRNTIEGRIKYYKRNALVRNVIWDLHEVRAGVLFTSPCYYCGAKGDPLNGIDRVDNSKPYSDDNSVACCYTCNMMKKTMTGAEFIEACQKVVFHNG